MLEAYFDAFAQGLLRTSSLASPEHFVTDLKQETSIAPFTIRQERQIACLLNDLAQELHGLFKELAFLASTVHLPQKTGSPIHQHNGPALRFIWSDILVHSRIQLIPFNELLQKLVG